MKFIDYSFGRWIGFTLSLGLLVFVGNVRAEDAPKPSEVVELPQITVSEDRELPPPEAWRYTQTEGFEVISNGPERETRLLLRDLAMFRIAMDIAWPVKFKPMPPSAIILCGRRGMFDQFLPGKDGTVDKSANKKRIGLTLNNREQAFIVMDIEASSIMVDASEASAIDAGTQTGSLEMNIDRNKQLYREYVRYLFSQTESPMPAWLEEGVCQLLMAMKISERRIEFGLIEDPQVINASQASANSANDAATAAELSDVPAQTAAVDDRDFNAALHRRALLSFKDFFGVTRDSDAAQNPLGNNVWAKQSYAFVHMCLMGRGGKFKKPFEDFIVRCAKEPATEKMFEECFGKSYAKMMTELRGYIDFTDYKHEQFNLKKTQTFLQPLPEMRDATEGESSRIKGDALRLAGKSLLGRQTLIAAYARGERGPQFLATLGLSEKNAGDVVRARKFLEAAVAAKCQRIPAYVELARLRLADATEKPAGKDGQINAEQLSSVLKPLFIARQLPPPTAEVYELIAKTWLSCELTPKAEYLGVVTEGLKLFPRDEELVYLAASLNARGHFDQAAHALVDHGLKIASSEAGRERFTKLKAGLPPVPAPTVP